MIKKMIKLKYLFLLVLMVILSQVVISQDKASATKEQVLDFSAGIIEGELNRPSILMELGSNFKDFDDLIFLRENFNSFHAIDSKERLRFVEEKK